MATCSAGPARCKIVCDGACGCVYVHSTDSCTCECFDTVGTGGNALGLGTIVSVSINGLSLGQVAARADRLLAREVLVPAARARQPVILRMRRVRFAEVLKRLGLATRSRGLPTVKRTARGRARQGR